MNANLRSGSLPFTFFLMLAISSVLSLAGCHEGPGNGFPPINLDSVRTHVLPIQKAIKMTTEFRNTRDTFQVKCGGLKEQLGFGNAEAFNSDAIRILLQQKDSTGSLATGIRIYYGLDKATGKVTQILVPIDKNGNDIINVLLIGDKDKQAPGVSPKTQSLTLDNGSGQTIEQGQQCPPVCDNGSSGLGGH
ncbi:MAG TPA: hypothetical protein VE035_08230 [Puia sp.]|nr:hypothetical protein [Puia sp.]